MKETIHEIICRSCGCSKAEALKDARTLGLQDEFQSGIYFCCQVINWADEQWLLWVQAASEDGKTVEEVTRPLELT
jgi:hypothetical protein